jgi:putative hydrolase of the HAD superfamily
MSIEVILFDADGVIQRQAADWQQALGSVLGRADCVDEFVRDVFAVERFALAGQTCLTEALPEVLARWHCSGSLGDALRAWTMIEVDAGVVEVVRTLRQSAVRCYLASNQESHRAHYMLEMLGYGRLFDREFYSCHLGVMKPAPAFFRAILNELRVSAGSALFIDDHEANIHAAREVGMQACLFPRSSGAGALRELLCRHGVVIA